MHPNTVKLWMLPLFNFSLLMAFLFNPQSVNASAVKLLKPSSKFNTKIIAIPAESAVWMLSAEMPDASVEICVQRHNCRIFEILNGFVEYNNKVWDSLKKVEYYTKNALKRSGLYTCRHEVTKPAAPSAWLDLIRAACVCVSETRCCGRERKRQQITDR